MSAEKRNIDEEALAPVSVTGGAAQRRRSAVLPRRIIAAVLGTFAIWSLYSGIDTLHQSWNQPIQAHPGHAECHGSAQRYMDRLVGGGLSVYTDSHKDNDKHHHHDGHHDKHGHHGGHHGKHDHDHKPPHGSPHGPPHGPPGPHPGHDHPHPHKWISPKEAEDIFLSVPNNDSIRA